MAIEFDILSGFDKTGVANPTKAQDIATVNEAEPLPNRSFNIYQSTTPDIASNPKFSRYIWLDSTAATPVLKVWTGAAWAVLPVAANSVIAASILNSAVTYNTKIGGFIAGDALKILRVNNSFDALETVSFSALLTNGSVPLTALPTTGSGPHYLLKWNAGNTALVYEAFSTALIGANVIALTSLVNGGVPQYGYIIRANPGTGVVEMVSNDDRVSSLFPVGSATVGILPSKLSTFGAATRYGIRYNTAGSVWEAGKIVHQSADTAMVAATLVINAEAHGLGGNPDNMRVFLVNKANGGGYGYTVGDAIPAESVRMDSGTNPWYMASMNNGGTTFSIGCCFAAGSTFAVPNAGGTTVSAATTRVNFVADWNIRVVLNRFIG